MTFPHGITLWYNGTFRLLYRTTHIRFQLRTLHLPITMDGVNLTIIIEQDAQVVDTPLHIMMLPWSTNILGSIALQPLTIDIRVDIELSVGITDARSPDALSINLLMILQRESIIPEVKTVETVTDILPVHQVLGMKDDQSRHRMHSGAGKIVVIPYP